MTTIDPSINPSKAGTRRANALPSGSMLDEYRIDSILGAGGFGVTYRALDTHLQTWVAIKEYFPVEWSFRDADGVTVHPNTQGYASAPEGQVSDYNWGLERFLDEARVLARIQHPCVVRVKRYFRGHGTAYIVMDFEDGEPLSAILQDGETLGESEVRGLLDDVLPALQAVHEQGYLHRDIKPANLYLRASDHRVMLIDFGAAREAIGRHSKSVTSLVTPGYSPPEQYTTRNDRYGTWTDIYALGAVLYRCVTGHTPVEAAERLLEDTLEPVMRTCAGRYSTNLLRVIDQALAVRPEQRFPTVAEMQAALAGSRDEDSDETIIMAPLARPGKPALAPEPSPTGRSPGVPLVERGDSSGWLDITQVPITPRQTAKHLSVLQAPPKTARGFPRRRLPGILAGGGLALGVLAAAVIWLWPSGPEPAPVAPASSAPPSLATDTPAVAPTVAEPPPPPLSGVAADAGAGVPPAQETVATTPPSVTEPSTPPPEAGDQAGMIPPPPAQIIDLTRQPVPVAEPDTAGVAPEPDITEVAPEPGTTGGAPEPAVGVTGVALPPGAAPAATRLQAGTPTPRSAAKPGADQRPRAREATKAPSRTTQRKTDRQRATQPTVATPAEPVQVRPTPPRRSNLWDAPADTGFNQK
jgi:serine/threonine protein kinase